MVGTTHSFFFHHLFLGTWVVSIFFASLIVIGGNMGSEREIQAQGLVRVLLSGPDVGFMTGQGL